MATSEILQLLLNGNQLKRTSRTGWVQRGVAQHVEHAPHGHQRKALAQADVHGLQRLLGQAHLLLLAAGGDRLRLEATAAQYGKIAADLLLADVEAFGQRGGLDAVVAGAQRSEHLKNALGL